MVHLGACVAHVATHGACSAPCPSRSHAGGCAELTSAVVGVVDLFVVGAAAASCCCLARHAAHGHAFT